MRVILIIPPSHSKRKIRRGLLPSLGIGSIAAVLEKEGCKVKIIDSQIMGYQIEDVINETIDFMPDLIGISAMTPTVESAYTLARFLKQKFSHIPIMLGGAHATCFPDEPLNIAKEIDIVVIGEGEYTVLDIVRRLKNGGSFDGVEGIYYRDKDGSIIKNPFRHSNVDLEELPFPARHLFPILQYIPEPYNYKRLPSTSIIASRGCTWAKCTFCCRSGALKREYRCQSPRKTIEEIRLLIDKHKIKDIIFYDDDLLSNKEWLLRFCDLLEDARFDITWSIRGRIGSTSYEVLKRVAEVGCWGIEYGFESGNQDLLDNIEKGITLQQSRQVAQWTKELGIETIGTFMLALPGETPKKGEETIKFAIELDCSYAAFIPTHPFQGTKLYEQCISQGKLVKPPYTERMLVTRYLPTVSYVPDGYKNPEEIEAIIKMAYRMFYLRLRYLYRHLRRIKNIEDIKRFWYGFKFLLGTNWQKF